MFKIDKIFIFIIIVFFNLIFNKFKDGKIVFLVIIIIDYLY